MPITFSDDYWIEFPGGKYTVGLLPDEARNLAEQSAAYLQHRGPEWSINDGKLLGRAFDLAATTGDAGWVERYLLAHHPAREVDIAPFAIARRPLLGGEYRQFMAETGETEPPNSWSLMDEFLDDERPVRGIAWAAATAFADWAGTRLPFEDEWERAVRGADRRLFPWGNEFAPFGWDVLDDNSARLWSVDATVTPDGLQAALIGMYEWCADYWREPSGIDRGEWREITPILDARPARGGSGKTICSAVSSEPFDPTNYLTRQAGVRLVRRDGRTIPPLHPETPRSDVMQTRTRAFEVHTLNPILQSLTASKLAWDHSIDIDGSGYYEPDLQDEGAGEIKLAAARDLSTVKWGPPMDTSTYVHGVFLTAVSRESIRRVAKQHGVFVWNIQYRYADDGVRARPVVAYHMMFNNRIHKFEHRFRAQEPDTRIDELTPDLIKQSIMDAFMFYELHADAMSPPPGF